jgi:20S proteasome subunit alpha 4
VLVGGFSKDGKPVLYSSEPSGFSSQWRSTAVGKNAEKVNEFLESKYKDNMEYSDAIQMILESMLEYVEAGSKNVEVAIMRKGKQMETVSDEEIDTLSSVIEEQKKKEGKKL